MKFKTYSQLILILFGLIIPLSDIYSQNKIQETVKDANTQEGLIGVNIIIKNNSTSGTATDIDGNFTLQSDKDFPWTIEISYTGYATKEITVTSNNEIVNIGLSEGINMAEIIVQGYRGGGKADKAVASISVLSERTLKTTSDIADPVKSLNNIPGVNIQSQSANRINISMRGSSGLFGTSVFPIMDYRSLIGPGIGTFQSDQSGISLLDLDRIQVVRGPASALYGPGVTQGVVHFITKSPIDKPGTSIELFGGELQTFGAGIRHATKISEKFGFKINAQYRQGNEFTLDPNNFEDSIQIAKFLPNGGIFQPAVSNSCLLYTSPSPRDATLSRMPSSA